MNLSTLQFQSVSINPTDPTELIAGTQDNGTSAHKAGTPNWPQSIWRRRRPGELRPGQPASAPRTTTGRTRRRTPQRRHDEWRFNLATLLD